MNKGSFKNEVEYLMALHNSIRIFIDKKRYHLVSNIMDSFTADDDINEIKTILVLIKGIENTELSKSRKRLLDIYNEKFAELDYE